jgi:hypothetical protein
MFQRLVGEQRVDGTGGQGHGLIGLQEDIHARFGGGGHVGSDVAFNVRSKKGFVRAAAASVVEEDSMGLRQGDRLHPMVEVMEHDVVMAVLGEIQACYPYGIV